MKPATVRILALTLSLLPSFAAAQTFPSKPVRIVVPYPAGGTGSAIAHPLGQELTRIWGQPVIVDNRPGAGTIIGAEHVARSAPDGYTLLFASSAALTFNQSIYKKLDRKSVV